MIEVVDLLGLEREIDRRTFVRRMFALGAGFAASGAIVRAVEALAPAEARPDLVSIALDPSPFGFQVDDTQGLSTEAARILKERRFMGVHDDDYIVFANPTVGGGIFAASARSVAKYGITGS
jgi:hypothetical protein